MIPGRRILFVTALLCADTGCGDDSNGKRCEPFDWATAPPDAGVSAVTGGAPVASDVGRLEGCEDDSEAPAPNDAAAACSDPADLSGCQNPFAPPPSGDREAMIRAQFGPCACELPTRSGSLAEGTGYLRLADD